MNESVAVVSATRIGGHAYRYLHNALRWGKVSGRFSNGVNLSFSGNGAVVVVQTRDVPFHPWGIEVPAPPDVPVGDAVVAENGRIAIGAGAILFAHADIHELSLPAIDAEGGAVFLRRTALDSSIDSEKERPHDPFYPLIDRIIARWENGHEPGTLLELIGVGSGATPSGDDILAGFIAGLSVLETMDPRVSNLLNRLRADIRKQATRCTALLSAQILSAACDRSFAEPVLDLLLGIADDATKESEISDRVVRVARFGNRSGVDFLHGLAVARRYLRSLS